MVSFKVKCDQCGTTDWPLHFGKSFSLMDEDAEWEAKCCKCAIVNRKKEWCRLHKLQWGNRIKVWSSGKWHRDMLWLFLDKYWAWYMLPTIGFILIYGWVWNLIFLGGRKSLEEPFVILVGILLIIAGYYGMKRESGLWEIVPSNGVPEKE